MLNTEIRLPFSVPVATAGLRSTAVQSAKSAAVGTLRARTRRSGRPPQDTPAPPRVPTPTLAHDPRSPFAQFHAGIVARSSTRSLGGASLHFRRSLVGHRSLRRGLAAFSATISSRPTGPPPASSRTPRRQSPVSHPSALSYSSTDAIGRRSVRPTRENPHPIRADPVSLWGWRSDPPPSRRRCVRATTGSTSRAR